jgi:hypothetical protein
MNFYGSDKGNGAQHNYTRYYFSLFEPIRYNDLNIFELGLGTNNINIPSNMGPFGKPCASLFAWEKYFPNARIYGADIDKNILIHKERISTFYCDQGSVNSIIELWNNAELLECFFDIIIDDALHQFNHNVTFFENSIHKLKKGGVYIIEDIYTTIYEEEWKIKLDEWKNKYPNMKFVYKPIYNENGNNIDNCLILIQKL